MGAKSAKFGPRENSVKISLDREIFEGALSRKLLVAKVDSTHIILSQLPENIKMIRSQLQKGTENLNQTANFQVNFGPWRS